MPTLAPVHAVEPGLQAVDRAGNEAQPQRMERVRRWRRALAVFTGDALRRPQQPLQTVERNRPRGEVTLAAAPVEGVVKRCAVRHGSNNPG
jgi:hypothetical protein